MLTPETDWIRYVAGFLGGAFAEIFGGGPVINQLASAPQAVLLTTLLVAVGSCVPAVKVSRSRRLTLCYTSYLLFIYALVACLSS